MNRKCAHSLNIKPHEASEKITLWLETQINMLLIRNALCVCQIKILDGVTVYVEGNGNEANHQQPDRNTFMSDE